MARKLEEIYKVKKFIFKYIISLRTIFFILLSFSFLNLSAQKDSVDIWRMEFDNAKTLLKEKQYITALEKLETCYQKADLLFNSQDKELEDITYTLGELYRNLTIYDRALPLLQRNITNVKTLYGETHINLIIAYNDLGFVYHKLENDKKALDNYNQAIALFDNTKHPSEHLNTILKNTLSSYKVLINNAAKDKDIKLIVKYYSDKVSIEKYLYGQESRIYLNSLEELALFQNHLHKFEEAAISYEKIFDVIKDNKEDAKYEQVITQLSEIYSELENFKKALQFNVLELENIEEKNKPKDEVYWLKFKNAILKTKIIGDTVIRDQLYSKALQSYSSKTENILVDSIFLGEIYLHNNQTNKAIATFTSIKDSPTTSFQSKVEAFEAIVNSYNNSLNFKKALKLSKEHIEFLKPQKNEKPDIYVKSIIKTLYLAEICKEEKYLITLVDELSQDFKNNPNFEAHIEPKLFKYESNIWSKFGLFEQELKVLYKAKEFYESADKENTLDYTNTILNIAETYTELGNYKLAESFLFFALQNIEKQNKTNELNYLKTIIKIGNNYALSDNLSAKKEAFEYVIKEAEKYEFETLPLLKVKATANRGLSNFENAYLLYKKVCQEINIKYDRYSQPYEDALFNLAQAALSAEKYNEALKLFNELVSLPYTVTTNSNVNLVKYFKGLGDAHFKLKEYKKAIINYNKIIENKIVMSADYALSPKVISNLKHCHYFLGHKDEFIKAIKQEVTLFFNHLNNNFSYMSELERFNYLATFDKNINDIKRLCVNGKYQSKELNETLLNLTLNLKGLLVSSLATSLTNLEDSDNQAVKDVFDKYKKSKDFLYNSNYEIKKAKELYNNWALVYSYSFESALSRIQASITDDKVISLKDWKNSKLKLRPKEIAIEYDLYTSIENGDTTTYYYAFIFSSDSDYPNLYKLCDQNELLELLNANSLAHLFPSRGARNANTITSSSEFKQIYNLIWKPFADETEGKETVYYSPSGLLHNLPFSLLQVNDDSILMEKKNLIQLNHLEKISETDVIYEPSSVTLFGGIEYNHNADLQSNSWKNLSGTLSEVQKIAKLLKSNEITVKSYTHKDATEQIFKNLDQKSTDVLHIATHGYYFSKNNEASEYEIKYKKSNNPLKRSGLLLADANYAWDNGRNTHDIEDGILTALEISNLNLSNTKLAVLSACNTGLGDIKGSEGVYGLKRAFQIANVNALIISLWEVPDLETVEFMTLFYKNWISTKNMQTAFKTTQKTMYTKYPNEPVKWAAFVLVQ